jgi:2-polyprenyl-3-methyl-5-hydroxy-6-metoxy-1,4-benzoquinol methylase
MQHQQDYIAINKALWNEKTRYHVDSEFYDVASFIEGRNSLNPIELDLLGDVAGKRILHLQCHFGQDTLSLARMGAHVTGMDFSEAAIDKARSMATEMNLDARFICCDVYKLSEHLDEEFDIVFASYGVLGWLPDMPEWARVAARYVLPGGKLILVEFHPVVWMFNYQFSEIAYAYFNTGPIVETLSGTYANKEAALQAEEVGWNHSLHEVLQSVLSAGLQLSSFCEYDYSPYSCFNNLVAIGERKHQVKGLEGKLPMVYAIVAGKPE